MPKILNCVTDTIRSMIAAKNALRLERWCKIVELPKGNLRVREWWKFHRNRVDLREEWTFEGHLVQLHSQSTVTYSRLSAFCSGRFWVSSRMETPQPVWGMFWCLATLAVKSFLLHVNGISCSPFCGHCLLFCPWASLRRERLHFLYFSPSGIYFDKIPTKPSLLEMRQFRSLSLSS